jgi:O-antigen ligase
VAYEERMQEMVEEGRVSSVVLEFNHAHNEWLDMFAKRGLAGVLALLIFFAVPASLYYQALRQRPAGHPSAHTALALCGLLTVVGFVGFGMTQVMFAHNNANMMYLFMNTLWLAALVAPAGVASARSSTAAVNV